MRIKKPLLYQFLGLLTNGDIGPYTMYTTRRNELVFFLKTWPKDPATYHQNLNRNRFRQAAARWRLLDQPTRDLWETLSKKANCVVTGYNLFVIYMLNKNQQCIRTLQTQTGIDVITPSGDPLPFPLQ